MKHCSEIMEWLEELAPKALACEWDNPGFQAGRADKEVHRVLVALDCTDEVITQALEQKADLIVTHHPLIFRPLKQVNDRNFISRRIVTLIQNDICLFSMHTNYDIAPNCMADLAAERMELSSEEPLEITGEVNGEPVGIGKIGTMPEALTVNELAELVKSRFGLPFLTVYGMDAVDHPIRRIAISPGAGGSMVKEALAKRAEVLITGDIGHHDGIDAAAQGMAIIDAGHYGIEQIFLPMVRDYLRERAGGELEVFCARPAFPAKVVV